jgi:polysaccharide biosynthesis protein PslE
LSLEAIIDKNLLETALFVTWKQKWKILSAFVFVMAVAVATVLLLPPTFEVTSTLLVKEGRSQLILGANEDKGNAFRTSEEVINSEVAILLSKHLHVKVIETLGVDVFKIIAPPPTTVFAKVRAAITKGINKTSQGFHGFLVYLSLLDAQSPFEEALALFEKKLVVSPLRKANVIELTLRSRNPVAAAKVLNTLVALYLERHNELHQTSGAYEFFQTQASRLRQQLEDSEQRLRAFQKQRGLVSLEEQKRLFLGQVADVTAGLERTRRENAELTARIQKVKGELKVIAENVTWSETRQRNPLLDSIGGRLVDLQQQREKLLTRFLPTSRQVQDIDQEIQRLQELQTTSEADRVSETTSGQNTTYKELEKMLVTDEARQAALQASQQTQEEALRDYQGRLQSLADQELEFKRLIREVEDNQADYQVYRKGLEEKRVEVEMNRQRIVKVSIIDPAIVPSNPIRPQKSLTLLMAMPIGLLVGVLFAFCVERYAMMPQGRSEVLGSAVDLPGSVPSPVVQE